MYMPHPVTCPLILFRCFIMKDLANPNRLLSTQVACALLMSGEELEKHIDVKNILVEMGIYFQVQVNVLLNTQKQNPSAQWNSSIAFVNSLFFLCFK